MSDSDKSSNSESKNNFWTTFPGVLTAVGAFIVAITGLITALQSIGIVKKLPHTQPPIASSPTSVNQLPSASQAFASTQSPTPSSKPSASQAFASTQSPTPSSKPSASQALASTQSPTPSSEPSASQALASKLNSLVTIPLKVAISSEPSASQTLASTQLPTPSSKPSASQTLASTQSPTPSSEPSASQALASTQSPTPSSEPSVSESPAISSSQKSSSKPSTFLAKTSSVPQITIDSLKDKPEVKSLENITGQLTGEVPSGESLWLYVYDTNIHKYHYHPISASGESWKAEDSVVFGEGDRTANSQFKVGVVLADAEVSKQLKNEPTDQTSQLGKLISEEIAVNRAN